MIYLIPRKNGLNVANWWCPDVVTDKPDFFGPILSIESVFPDESSNDHVCMGLFKGFFSWLWPELTSYKPKMVIKWAKCEPSESRDEWQLHNLLLRDPIY